MLGDAVESILQARTVPREIIVVDQSDDANGALEGLGTVRGCAVRYVHSTSRGESCGRNLGLRMAMSDIVVILDDDMLVNDDSLEVLLAPHNVSRPQLVTTGRVLPAP